MKQIETYIITWINRLIEELGNLRVKMSILYQLIYWLNAIFIKISAGLFVAVGKIILTFIWKGKENRIAKIILKQQNKAGKVSLPGLKNYFRDSGADRELNTQSIGIG